MKITLINPNIVTQKWDFSGTGIPFMPITLAYLASYLRKKGHESFVIDTFGESPKKIVSKGDFFIQGLGLQEILRKIPKDTDAVVLYANLVINHNINLEILRSIKQQFSVPVIIIENIHSVVGYSLLKVHDDFLSSGADFIVLSDPEIRCFEVLKSLKHKKIPKIDGIIFRQKGKKIIRPVKIYRKDLDSLPYPAWDIFPIRNYWDLEYAHAPLKKSYLPLLTSRGCPNNCEFCITPLMSGRIWRPRSPKNVVDEIEYYLKRFSISEFHIEDFNPTVSKQRTIDICKEILKRNLRVELKIVAGTKAETIDKETISWMKKAGFSYISISPESGSKKMLKMMNKNFDYEHALDIVKYMAKIKIFSQACFVIGFPGETEEDLNLTRRYVKELVKAGIDEIALFIMTPIPGSRACNYSQLGYKDLSNLTFSPKWRSAYKELSRFRTNIYAQFIFWKFRYHPLKLIRNIFNVLTKRFEIKMEMALWRVVRMHIRQMVRRRL
jgi:radical SAM superfamily enzyme YgiQ (UPF0313 family)